MTLQTFIRSTILANRIHPDLTRRSMALHVNRRMLLHLLGRAVFAVERKR